MRNQNQQMQRVDEAYIDGAFVRVQGSERVDSVNPATGQTTGTAVLADREDARLAIAAARRAQEGLRRTGCGSASTPRNASPTRPPCWRGTSRCGASARRAC